MTNNELKKILIWIQNNSQKGFIWNDLKQQFSLDEARLDFVQQYLQAGMYKSDWLVDYLISTGNELLLSITQKGNETLINLKSQKSPLYNFFHNPWVITIGSIALTIAIGYLLPF